MSRRWGMAGIGIVGAVLLAAGAVCLTSGCSTLGYYSQSVAGHLRLVGSAKPVPDWLADDSTPEALKARLALSQQIRDFAVTELKLPDNASYRRYAELNRNAAVWNVVAAPELGLRLKTWCFPVVGCVGYRGYFERADAEVLAAQLRAEGWEVQVYGVPAYSTLGAIPGDFFADPLLNTFIRFPEGELARMIFHELAHQVAFAPGDTMFNESFATAVERLGGKRWLTERASQEALAEYRSLDGRREAFRLLALATREKLMTLYRSDLDDDAKRQGKAALMAEMRSEHQSLKAGAWGGFSGYDGWFARANNASFGVMAAYNELVPDFERLFEREGRDFDRFYAEVRRLAALPRDERRQALQGP